MKRIFSIVLAIVMALALAACSNNTNNNNNSNGAKEINMTAQEVLGSIALATALIATLPKMKPA